MLEFFIFRKQSPESRPSITPSSRTQYVVLCSDLVEINFSNQGTNLARLTIATISYNIIL